MVVEDEAEASDHHSANRVHRGREGSEGRLPANLGLGGSAYIAGRRRIPWLAINGTERTRVEVTRRRRPGGLASALGLRRT